MFTVRYKCKWRDYWYDDLPDCETLQQAIGLAQFAIMSGYPQAIIMDPWGRIVASLP